MKALYVGSGGNAWKYIYQKHTNHMDIGHLKLTIIHYNYTIETGLIGLLIFLVLIILVVIKFIKNTKVSNIKIYFSYIISYYSAFNN
jgi:hypothetical protein